MSGGQGNFRPCVESAGFSDIWSGLCRHENPKVYGSIIQQSQQTTTVVALATHSVVVTVTITVTATTTVTVTVTVVVIFPY